MAKITMDQIMDAVERDELSGFCIACGFEQFEVEPDARKYICEECGEPKVYGAQELLFMVGA